MADSSITKKALAAALKDLIQEQPFAKISVGEICERCLMNRKSFYYHFRDKYDLVNWIFDTEFLETAKSDLPAWEAFGALCHYFYQNQEFYRKVLQIEGQNSFTEHFRQLCLPAVAQKLEAMAVDEVVAPFYVHFVVDAILCAIERWLTERNGLSPDEFLEHLRLCMTAGPLLCAEAKQEDVDFA